MKKTLLTGVLAVALAAAGIYSTNVLAQPQTFALHVHIEYPDGFVYDGVVETSLSPADAASRLAACGQGHRWGAGSVVLFHCYVVPE